MKAETRVLYYAFGGGLGHITRSLSLLRQLARLLPGQHRLLANSPFANCVEAEVLRTPGAELVCAAPRMTPASAITFIGGELDAFEPSILIVDTFPRGLGGEFASLLPKLKRKSLCVLVSRTLPRRYVDLFELSDFVSRNFNLIIAPGEESPFKGSQHCFETDAFLIRDSHELDLNKAQERLGAQSPILLIGTGTASECDQVEQIARDVNRSNSDRRVVFMRPEEQVALPHHYPLIELLPAVGAVVSAAGYNVAHEVQALGVPSLLFPRKRLYDDQTTRANATLPTAENVNSFIANLEHPTATRAIPSYFNGAAQAAQLIAKRAQDEFMSRARS